MFSEYDNAKIFIQIYENLTLEMSSQTRENNLIAALDQGALDRVKGKLNCDRNYKNLEKMFFNEFIGTIIVPRKKEKL